MFNKHLQAKVNRNYTSSETSLLLQNPLQVLSQLTVVQIVLLTHVLTRQLLQTHCHVQLSSLALSLSRQQWAVQAGHRRQWLLLVLPGPGLSAGCEGEPGSVAAGNSDSEDVAMRSWTAEQTLGCYK